MTYEHEMTDIVITLLVDRGLLVELSKLPVKYYSIHLNTRS